MNRLKRLIHPFLLLLLFSSIASYAEPANQQTVMVFGDNLSSGLNIEAGKNWVSLLQQCINNMHEDVLVINESINGDTTSGGVARLAESLEAYQPDVVIIALGTNDQLLNVNNSITTDNLEKMIRMNQKNDAKVLLVGSPLHNSKLQQTLKTISSENNIPLISNLYMELDANTPGLYIDELHAGTQAQQTIMNTIWKQLFPILGL